MLYIKTESEMERYTFRESFSPFFSPSKVKTKRTSPRRGDRSRNNHSHNNQLQWPGGKPGRHFLPPPRSRWAFFKKKDGHCFFQMSRCLFSCQVNVYFQKNCGKKTLANSSENEIIIILMVYSNSNTHLAYTPRLKVDVATKPPCISLNKPWFLTHLFSFYR